MELCIKNDGFCIKTGEVGEGDGRGGGEYPMPGESICESRLGSTASASASPGAGLDVEMPWSGLHALQQPDSAALALQRQIGSLQAARRGMAVALAGMDAEIAGLVLRRSPQRQRQQHQQQ